MAFTKEASDQNQQIHNVIDDLLITMLATKMPVVPA